MDMDIPRNFELRIIHDSESENINTVHCTVSPMDESSDEPSGEVTLDFETVLHDLEHTLGLPDPILIGIMDDYVKSGCSRFRLTATPAKLRNAGLLIGKRR